MKILNRLISILLVFISISSCTSISKLPVNFNSRVSKADVEVKQKPDRIATANKTSVTLKLPADNK